MPCNGMEKKTSPKETSGQIFFMWERFSILPKKIKKPGISGFLFGLKIMFIEKYLKVIFC